MDRLIHSAAGTAEEAPERSFRHRIGRRVTCQNAMCSAQRPRVQHVQLRRIYRRPPPLVPDQCASKHEPLDHILQLHRMPVPGARVRDLSLHMASQMTTLYTLVALLHAVICIVGDEVMEGTTFVIWSKVLLQTAGDVRFTRMKCGKNKV